MSYLYSFLAINLTVLSYGNHFLNSLCQLLTTEFGHTIKCGPFIFLNSDKQAKNAIAYIVLPRPISSANIALKPIEYKLINQFKPTI